MAKKGLTEVPREEMDEKLQVLDLSHNYISRVSIDDMPMLTRLDLSCNQVSYVDCLPTSLVELHLAKNQIANLTCLSSLTNLKTLDLSFNKINDLDFLKHCQKLQILKLEKNLITSTDGLSKLVNLVEVDLSFNMLEKIQGLHDLKKLEKLTLVTNVIQQIEDIERIEELTSLQDINVIGNPVQLNFNQELISYLLVKVGDQLKVINMVPITDGFYYVQNGILSEADIEK